MTLLLKDPAALLDYAVDWGADYLNEDQVAASAWSVEPQEDDGLSVLASDHGLTQTSVTVLGGVAGHVYRLINHAIFVSGREDQRAIVVRVEWR
jgi:hypothetical protein